MKRTKGIIAIGAVALLGLLCAVSVAEAGRGGGFGGIRGGGGGGFKAGAFRGYSGHVGGFKAGKSFSTGRAYSYRGGKGVARAYRGGGSYAYRSKGYAYGGGNYGYKHYKGKNYGYKHYGYKNYGHYPYRRYAYRPYWYGVPYAAYGYYGGGCGWLYRNAVATGNPYWWNRYYECID